jgi:hypothetical protein
MAGSEAERTAKDASHLPSKWTLVYYLRDNIMSFVWQGTEYVFLPQEQSISYVRGYCMVFVTGRVCVLERSTARSKMERFGAR